MEAVNHTVSEITVVYSPVKLDQRPVINTSSEAHIHLFQGYDKDIIGLQEQIVALYLNRSNRVLGVYRAGVGGITGTVADIRLILSVALKIAATGIILSHNHPSSNLKPSQVDEELTQRLKEAGKVMDIKLLDHLILEPSGEQYFSFADEGLL